MIIKKITLTLIFVCLIVSCGKKGDPEYKDPKNTSKNQNIIINKV